MSEKIISTLASLARACGNNKKAANTGSIVMKALLCCFTNADEEEV